MIYLDTSAFVSIYVREVRSDALIAALAAARDDLAVSSWTITEISSALALKVRTGALTGERRVLLAAKIEQVLTTEYRREEIDDSDFDIAALMIAQVATPLRAGDALHLAVCRRLGARLLSLDRDMILVRGLSRLRCWRYSALPRRAAIERHAALVQQQVHRIVAGLAQRVRLFGFGKVQQRVFVAAGFGIMIGV